MCKITKAKKYNLFILWIASWQRQICPTTGALIGVLGSVIWVQRKVTLPTLQLSEFLRPNSPNTLMTQLGITNFKVIILMPDSLLLKMYFKLRINR